MAVFDGRVGIGGHDDATGSLRVFVDTDDPAAMDWDERLLEYYRETATPL